MSCVSCACWALLSEFGTNLGKSYGEIVVVDQSLRMPGLDLENSTQRGSEGRCADEGLLRLFGLGRRFDNQRQSGEARW